MYVLRNMFGLKVASFVTLTLAVHAAAAGSHQRGYVAEVWYEYQTWDAGAGYGVATELVVTFRGPATYYPEGLDDYR